MARTCWRGVGVVACSLLVSLLFNAALGSRAAAADGPAMDKPVMTLVDATRCQPAGGEFRFTTTGNPDQVEACLNWVERKEATPCSVSLTVRRVAVSSATPPVVTFAAVLPRDLTPPDEAKAYYSFMPASVFTAAYVRVSAANTEPTVFTVGITRRWYAGVVTLLAVLIAGWVLYRFAIYLGVPGPKESNILRLYSVPLRVISTANGWASLSQFQIMLWSFVIGAGAVYVITLTGSLIPISAGTLALLGIAGGATVLSEVKANQQGQGAAPGPVLELRTVGNPLATEIVVAWLPPAAGAPVSGYIVQYADAATPDQWRYASCGLRTTSPRIVGLTPGTNYRVRVLATNAAGRSAEEIVAAATAPGTVAAVSVTNLRIQSGSVTDASVKLVWDAPQGIAGADFVVQMRPTNGDEGWTDVPDVATVAGTSAELIVRNLEPGIRYNFRARTQAAPGAWSDIVIAFTAARVRTPKWSDIVTDTDKPAEIDVTRVQMLFFTVISAFFVALKIIDTGTIPEIDNTYVMLMGISNGVYVTTKFVRN
jgi:Fibronectin type III domain